MDRSLRPLHGKVALVTGAGHGLGEAYARGLASAGASVVVNDLGTGWNGTNAADGRAESVAREIEGAHGTAFADTSDCSDWSGAQAMIDKAVDRFGNLDILVLNAGIMRLGRIHEFTESDLDDVLRVHLKGAFATLHFAAKHWQNEYRKRGCVYGRVITTSSAIAFYPDAAYASAAYATAKSGIVGLTVMAAHELGQIGVTVNCVMPGAATQGERTAADGDLGKRMTADRVTPIIVELASPGASSVTGRVFEAIGGDFGRLDWTIADRMSPSGSGAHRELAAALRGKLGGPPPRSRTDYLTAIANKKFS